jgi:hypothetical protein
VLGEQVRECLARLSSASAIGVNGTDDVGDLFGRTIGQGAVRTLGGRTP